MRIKRMQFLMHELRDSMLPSQQIQFNFVISSFKAIRAIKKAHKLDQLSQTTIIQKNWDINFFYGQT